MSYKKGTYLLDKSDGEIVLLLEKLQEDNAQEQWICQIIKESNSPENRNRLVTYFIAKNSCWKILTKIDLILLGIKQ